MSEEIKESPNGELKQGEFKIKKKPGRPKKLTKKDEPIKLDLSKKEEPKEKENAISESRTGNMDETQSTTPVSEVVEEVRELPTETSEPVESKLEHTLEEITNTTDQKETKEVVEDIKEELKENPQIELPENIENLVDFMKDTGGTVEDYVRLNADYSNVDDSALLSEYYRNTKPHLNQEEINFILEDNFLYDEDVDEERTVKKKQLAYKEEIAKAKNFLEDLKSKYYEEIN